MRQGDCVVCVDNKPNGSSYIMTDVPLTIGKSYIVQQVAKSETIRVYYIKDNTGEERWYNDNRFKDIATIRKEKLNQLGI